MSKVPEIEFDNITIAAKHIDGYDYERCKVGLWSAYNVIKKILSCYSNGFPLHVTSGDKDTTYAKLLECLYMIGANSKFKDDDFVLLIYSGKTNKKYRRNMPTTKYLFALEKFGFVFNDLVTLKEDIPKNKLSVKDITQFSLSYNAGDFTDVIFGIKLFSDICMKQTGDCFFTGDIRVAFVDAPKLYAPPIDEVFYFLPEGQKKIAYTIHNKLEELKCVRNLEREYMTKYMHPKLKGHVFTTIFAAEHLYFLPESETQQKLAFKFNLRNISRYADYLSACTESIRQSVIRAEDCGMCNKKCGGVVFSYEGKTYSKCLTHIFRFNDLSEKAVDNYIKLIEFEDRELQNNR